MTARYELFVSVLLLFASVPAIPQTEPSTAPVKWERYSIPNRNISLLLPKLPTVVDAGNPCGELDKRSYYAYADQTVYELVVVAKSRIKPPDWCREKKRFGEESFSARLEELREVTSGNGESQLTKFGRQVAQFENDSAARWIVPDLKNSRWVEIAIHGRENRKEHEQQLLDSLDLDSTEGIDIGEGAKTTLGDASSAAPPFQTEKEAAGGVHPAEQKSAAETDRLQIISKPRATYTDAARRANVSGSVRLKVTMTDDGSVGKITPVKELTHGLTEQAIDSARRLVFLPKRANGVAVTTVVTIDYSFSIY